MFSLYSNLNIGKMTNGCRYLSFCPCAVYVVLLIECAGMYVEIRARSLVSPISLSIIALKQNLLLNQELNTLGRLPDQ